MDTIRLSIHSEYGQLESVIVNAGKTLVGPLEVAAYHEKHGSQIEHEVKDHPEAAPWDPDRVRVQHRGFTRELENRGIELLHAGDVPGAIYALFTRDAGFVVGKTFYFARPGDGVRWIERDGLRYIANRFPDRVELDQGIVEGGDVFVHGRKVFVGLTRYSTNREGFEGLRTHLSARGFECIPIRLRSNVLHLDCRFNIVGPDLALLHKEDVHPEDVRVLEREFRIIPIPRKDLLTLAPNVFSLSPDEVVVDARNDALARALESEGLQTLRVEYDEVTKLWGAFRCSTLPLRRT